MKRCKDEEVTRSRTPFGSKLKMQNGPLPVRTVTRRGACRNSVARTARARNGTAYAAGVRRF